MKINNDRSLDSFLKDTFSTDFIEGSEVGYTLAQIAGRASEMQKASGMSVNDLLAKTDSKFVMPLIEILCNGASHEVTLEALAWLSQACGYTLDVKFKKVD